MIAVAIVTTALAMRREMNVTLPQVNLEPSEHGLSGCCAAARWTPDPRDTARLRWSAAPPRILQRTSEEDLKQSAIVLATFVVLQRLRESESVVPAGEPLVAIGDLRQLEIVTDLLSTDAVRVAPGTRATIEQWGGEVALDATVRRIEPAGFTKVSALGVEEQRVNVILDFVEPGEACASLGDAYRVEARVVLWEAPDVLKVPTSALFREGTRWAVFVASDGRARRAFVELGQQTGDEAEVISGLTDGAAVIVHPGDLVRDGVRITDRKVG